MKYAVFSIILTQILLFMLPRAAAQKNNDGLVRIAVAGTTHGHSSWILGRKNEKHVEVVGIYEKNTALAKKQARQFNLPDKLFYTSLGKMLDEVKPQAVVAFGSIFDHLSVVEACAPRGIHVMVEKPLAVSVEHANRIEALALKHYIHVLTNYETSWYPATARASQVMKDGKFAGKIRKAVFHHGHEGPKEIGVSDEFLEWLTDPVQNGGGALIDFGCYGANIMTELMGNSHPLSVTAAINTYKPAIYPKVDDEATIIVEYPGAQAIIQASWNWPFGRKDMEVYGEKGYFITTDASHVKFKNAENQNEKHDSLTADKTGVYTDPFAYFADVVRKKITLPEYGYYSLKNNMMVVRILEAARQSAQSGKKVIMKQDANQ